MEKKLRLDFIGQFVGVGDKVAYNPPRWKGLVKGVVISFTPKGFRVLPDSAAKSKKSYEDQLKYYTTVVFELIKFEGDEDEQTP